MEGDIKNMHLSKELYRHQNAGHEGKADIVYLASPAEYLLPFRAGLGESKHSINVTIYIWMLHGLFSVCMPLVLCQSNINLMAKISDSLNQ